MQRDEVYDQVIRDRSRTMSDYILEPLPRSLEGLEAFYLRRPGSMMGSVLILFCSEGVVLVGDLIGKSMNSPRAYGKGWFSSHLSEGYLAEKFLPKTYVPELAAVELEELAREVEESDMEEPECSNIAGSLRGLKGEVYSWDFERKLYDQLQRFQESPYESVGYGYDPGDFASLVCIQRCFRWLIWEGGKNDG